jgi:hypothetical protein
MALDGEVLAPVRSHAAVLVNASPFRRDGMKTLVLPEGGTIHDAVMMSGVGPRLRRHLDVYLADHKIDARHWKRIRPKPGAALYIRVRLRGGDDGGKDVLRTVMMIAVVVVAAMFAGPLAAALGLGGALGTALVTTGLIMAGQMLVNALIPPPEAAKDPWRFDQQPGNPYASLTGLRNQYAPYAPIPRVMGQRRMYPVLGARPYTETQGKTQWLRMVLLVGYGPIDVADIRIGQTPISAFQDCEVEIREGWDDDLPLTLYTTQIREERMTAFLEYNVPVTKVTEYNTTEVSIDVSFPGGIITIDPDDGDRDSRTARFDVEWSVDNASWNDADWIDGKGTYGTGVDGELVATDKTTSSIVRSGRFKVTGAANGQYYVRLKRTTTDGTSYQYDDAYWTALRSVRSGNPINMPGLCVIALRLKATNQLNGVPDIISCLASAYHDVYDPDTETWTPTLTRNPAWQATDVLRKRGAVTICDESRIDLDAFVAFAAANDALAPNAAEKRWTSDIVLEGGSVGSAAQLLCAAGRAALTIGSDGKYTVARDVAQTVPVAHISPRNSWGYRGSKTFLDLPHALRITYINPDASDQQDEIIVYRDGYNEDGSGGNTAASRYDTLDLPTCRSATQAWREGRYHLAVLELRPEEHRVNQDIESLACTKGSFVQFAYDTVSIGLGQGRIAALETSGSNITALVLDIEIEMPNAILDYAVRVRHADGSTSMHVLDYDAGPTDTLVLQTPIAIAGGPEVGDLALFGEHGIESAPMLVKNIRRFDNLNAQLTLVDAQSGVWTADTGAIPAYQSYINRTTPIPETERPSRPILNVRSDEVVMLRLGDGTLIERVELRLDPYTTLTVPAVRWEAEYKSADANGEDWDRVGSGQLEASLYISDVPAGDVIHIRARVISNANIPSDWEYVFDHTVVGKTTPPDAPTGFAVEATLDGGKASWTPSTAVDITGYELRYGGASWEAATVLGFVFGRDTKQVFHTISIAGGETFRIKALDAAGLYSSEATAAATGRTNASGGVITDWRGLPTNAGLGVAVVRSVSAPLSSSSSSSISVAAHDMYFPGQTVSLPSDTITGLATDTAYYVFYDRQALDYIAVTSVAGYLNDTANRYIAVGIQRTQDGGGGFTPPPPPPPGGGGGSGSGGGGGELP